MRLWSLHPRYLDRQGLLACWREGLLAQAVLRGLTKGYRNHPQLTRFRSTPDPVLYIAAYLDVLRGEAESRGYAFDRSRLFQPPARLPKKVTVTDGQLAYEAAHLRRKLALRSPDWLATLDLPAEKPAPHPLFKIVHGGVAEWEITG